MSTSTSTCRSILLRAAPAPSSRELTTPGAVHILWLPEPILVEAEKIGSLLNSLAHPHSGGGFSTALGSLAGAPCAAITLQDASAADLHAAAERTKQLFPGCLSMAFDIHPGFDLESNVSATLHAMGMASSHDAPGRPSGKTP